MCFFGVFASIGISQPADLQFEHLTVANGLSQDIVSTLYRDQLGFLWIGTEDGLNRYDGYSIRSYKHSSRDSNSLSGNNITGICDFGAENLLVTNSLGMTVYDRAHDVFTSPQGSLRRYSSVQAKRPVKDRRGRYWIIVDDRNVLRYDPNGDSVRVYKLWGNAKQASIGFLHHLFIDGNDSLWVVAERSVGVFEEGEDRFRVFATKYKEPDVANWSAIREKSGDLWIATNGGLYRFDRRRTDVAYVPLNFTMGGSINKGDQLVGGLCWDRRDRLWLGGFNGLYCFDPKTGTTNRFSHMPNNPMSLLSNRIYNILLDSSNVLWAGTWRGGLSRTDLKKERFGHYRHSETTPFAGEAIDIIGMVEQPKGTYWFASTGGGLTEWRRVRSFDSLPRSTRSGSLRVSLAQDFGPDTARDATWRTHANFLNGDVVSLTSDNANNLWLTLAGRIVRFDVKRNEFVTISRPELKDKQIQAIYNDHLGDIWVGVLDIGILRYAPSTGIFTYYKSEQNDSGRPLTGAWLFFEDHAGNLWAGGWGGNNALFKYDREKNYFTSVNKPELQSARTALEDDKGDLWIGTWGLGMSRYSPGTGIVQQYLDQDGLPNNYVKGILADRAGNLWISTEYGMAKFSPSTQTFRNYTVSDGLQGNFFYTGSCMKGSDGRLYFGGPNGFNAFIPDSIREESYSVPVVLTDFRVFDRPRAFDHHLSQMQEITLPSKEDMFSFEYVSLDFSSPERNRYAYRLIGYDNDWILAGARRYASYTHLDPGEYVFDVRGTNSEGVWSANVASIRLTITPAFWQTWWFKALLVLIASALLYSLYRYRLSKLLEIERTRAAIATDLHDDIGTSLTNIALFSDLARREVAIGSPDAAKRLDKISETSRSLLDAMNDIVWSIKPENDALEQTILRMEDYAVEVLAENGIDLHVEIPEQLKNIKLPMKVRRNLFLIFKEAIGNVLKHANATHVDVVIASEQADKRAELSLTIIDNGRGFDMASPQYGNGLQNMNIRSEHLGGKVRVQSDKAHGTKVEIRFPLKSLI